MNEQDAFIDGLQGYIEKWLATQPQQRAALAFVDPGKYPGHVALAALEQEWLGAAYGIGEAQVAAAKLGWWVEELHGASDDGGQHPLTQVLFASDHARQLPLEVWTAPLLAAAGQLAQGTAADFAAQLAASAPLHGALAALETHWWFGATAESARAARLATLAHQLTVLARLQDDLERDRLPLPMAQLARHGLSRADLATRSAARDAAIRAQLDDLQAAWREALRLPGPLSVFRTLEARAAFGQLLRARQADDPLAALQQVVRPGFGGVFAAWRAARRWHRSAA